MKQNKKSNSWFFIALVAVLFAAPHAMVIRIMVDEADPFYWVLTRFLVGSVVILPFMLMTLRWSKIKRAWKYIAIASFSMALATVLYTTAIFYSQASYVSILTMLTPIILILISAHYFKERVTPRKIAGITLAMLGAFVVVVLPFLLTHKIASELYPLATILSLVQSVLFVIALIAMRKANEAGASMLSVVGFTMPAGVLVALPLFLILGDHSRTPDDLTFFAAATYSAIGIAVVFRAVTIRAYERIGAIPTAALQYIETLVAIALPVVLIGEFLSLEMIIGGTLIVLGVYLIESHKTIRTKHQVVHRHH